MPSTRLFGRRWRLATDILIFPAICEIVLRALWLAGVSAAYAAVVSASASRPSPNVTDSTSSSNDASNVTSVASAASLSSPFVCGTSYRLVDAFLLASVALHSLVLIDSVIIAVLSSRGTMTAPGARRRISPFVATRAALVIVELFLAIFGAVAVGVSGVAAPGSACPGIVGRVCVAGVVFGFLLTMQTPVVLLCIYDPLGKRRMRRKTKRLKESMMGRRRRREEIMLEIDRTKSYWTCLQLVCCSFLDFSAESDRTLRDVAAMMTEMFDVEDDIIFSDVAAGLILVAGKQRRRQLDHLQEKRPSLPRISTTRPLPLPWMTPANVARFSKYAIASYNWPVLLTALDPCCGGCRLLRRGCCCAGQRRSTLEEADFTDLSLPVVVDADCCSCDVAGLRAMIELPGVRLALCHFPNDIYMAPFIVAVDDDARSIVVAVRGSLSFADALCDVVMTTTPLFPDEVDVDEDLVGHTGIATNAARIFQLLVGHRVLERLRSGDRKDYAVTLTGHSLGGGVAPILAMKLKRFYEAPERRATAPEIRCFAFSPPGGLMSEKAVQLSKECVLSIIVGNDIITRLSYQSFVQLKSEIVQEIRTSKEPKYRIISRGLCAALRDLCCRGGHSLVTVEPRDDEEEEAGVVEEKGEEESREGEEVKEERKESIEEEREKMLDRQMPSATEALQMDSQKGLQETLTTKLAGIGDDALELPQDSELTSILLNDPNHQANVRISLKEEPKLYQPGHILLLAEIGEGIEAKWTGPSSLQEIIVCPAMIKDHTQRSILRDSSLLHKASEAVLNQGAAERPDVDVGKDIVVDV